MGDFSEVLLKGGPVALVLAMAIALKYAVEAFVSWRQTRNGTTANTTADSASANATLLDLLRIEREENGRKDDRIDELEHEVSQLREQLFEQRRIYEAEIGQLRRKIQDVTIQLEGLQARLNAGLPPLSH